MNHSSNHDTPLATALRKNQTGEVLFSAADKGRYATDASIYQIMPIGVVVPKTQADLAACVDIARSFKVPLLPRGAGTSQCGQTVGEALVIDTSKYLRNVISVDTETRTAVVEPGLVLDHLNAALKPHNLWFPVDVSTAAQATLGGMAGNNSCGSRSIRYGNMVHNVKAIEARLYDGSTFKAEAISNMLKSQGKGHDLAHACAQIYQREEAEINARWPQVLRRVQGYNLDHLGAPHHNLAHLLVGSEGTLALTERLHLKLSPLDSHKVLGVCHFASFQRAMELTQHIVTLSPTAVELVDKTMIDLARDNQAFAPIVKQFLVGEPEAILLVEFAGQEHAAEVAKLKQLVALLADHGQANSVVEIIDPKLQSAVWTVRKAGLNIMMSMKGDGKPVSFIEDCAVPLAHLAEYTAKLTEVFAKHGTKGTWYAHASVGTLHVRPVLNMRADGAIKMRAIAEEACALVRHYKGAFSGEHGDGLVRSEWIAPIIGERLTGVLAEVKQVFDPDQQMNPGKIVKPSKMDDSRLFRTPPGYQTIKFDTGLNWKQEQGFDKAVEMCNNNGHCRKFDADTMCPSYRVTRDEQHLTRGRANSLRLALQGEGITAPALAESMDLCVSCKGCKRDCPTGIDMAKMKIEWQYQHKQSKGFRLRDFLIADLPKYAPWASRLRGVLNLRNRLPWLAKLLEAPTGFAASRPLPEWKKSFQLATDKSDGKPVVLWVDTFNRHFKPELLHATVAVLEATGHAVIEVQKGNEGLCCGRTYLATGMLKQAKAEASASLMALRPYLDAGTPIVGLEPSCILTLRDEWLSLDLGKDAERLAKQSFLLAEYLTEHHYDDLKKVLKPAESKFLLHGHCHQKAFDLMPAVNKLLAAIPNAQVEQITSSCCGMAGSFGYEVEHQEVSRAMAELSLLPAVRKASADTVIVADGFSCSHQIADLAERATLSCVEILARHLKHS